MFLSNKPRRRALLVGASLLCAIPALGQDAPESLLPPGFGEPDKPAVKASPPPKVTDKPADKPVDLLPDISLKTPGSSAVNGGLPTPDTGSAANALPGGEAGDQPTLVATTLQDLPPHLRRSTAQVGVLSPGDGGMGAAAFAGLDGKFISGVMRKIDAPIASRWASIVLRRALLSRTDTPSGVNGADWVAERAWLLLRMGEAQSALMLVQAVDIDQYTLKMFDVAMQASLATADPAGMCPMVEPALSRGIKEPSWVMARAICAGLAGESAQASSLIDIARSKTKRRGIDALLAEKVIGAGGNTRRAVNIQWDDVPVLTAWRYGLASATAVEIPQRLMKNSGPHVHAWQARSPLLTATKRVRAADVAASLGVLSSAALVDHYGAMADETDPSEQSGKPFMLLRASFVAGDQPVRVDAMKQLWKDAALDARGRYARLLLTARAAALISPSAVYSADIDSLVGSMLSAGLDIQAERWASLSNSASGDGAVRARGLLAVGGTRPLTGFGVSDVASYQSAVGGEEGRRGKFLFAALAGLGRLSANDISSMAESLEVPVGRSTAWTRTLNQAVASNSPGAVAVLCAAGLQSEDWSKIPPVQLYHIVSALRRSGYEAEARMIAAEALMRA